MITLMVGGIGAGMIPRSTSPITINTFSNIEQGRVVDIFRPTSNYCNIAPTISSLGWIVDGLVYISNSPITNNSISLWSQQCTTVTLVMGFILSGLIHLSTSPSNINYCYPIVRGRVDGLKISTSTTSAVTWGRVAVIKRPMSKNFLTWRYFKTFSFINFIIVVTKVGEIMDGLTRPISYTSITTHR